MRPRKAYLLLITLNFIVRFGLSTISRRRLSIWILSLKETIRKCPVDVSLGMSIFIVLVGHWAEPILSELTELVEKEFSLPYFEFVYDEHWDLGHGWSGDSREYEPEGAREEQQTVWVGSELK